MYSNRLVKVLLHPFFIGLVITVTLLLFTPPWFSKYTLKETGREIVGGNAFYYFEDLDLDGFSEKILIDLNNAELTKVQLIRNNKSLTYCNLSEPLTGGDFLFSGSYDKQPQKELFLFTIKKDSIFLNILDLLSEDPYILRKRYIDYQRAGRGESESPVIRKIGFQDFDGDGYQELIFAISTGYRKQPRNCYIFNIARNKLITSPESGASIIQAELFDMTGDSLPEIVCSSFAPGNMDSLFPYSDQQGWLMVYDKNLKFVFQPVKFEKHPCQVTAIPFKSGNVNRIATLNHYFGPDTISSTLGIFDSSGACLRQLKLPPSNNTYSLFAADHNSFYLLGAKSSEIELRDTAFNVLRRIESPEFNDNTVLKILDADDDGSDEYFFKGNRTGSYYLARSDFSTITSINVGIDYAIFSPFISMIHKGDQHPEIYLPVEQVGILLNYSRNPLFSFRFLVYCVVYITLSALLYVVYVMQRYLARIQYETKRRMNELQLKSIRNQIDPHFTFNVLNSIGSLYSQSENRKTADFLFGKYARLLRETIITSDQTEVTLEHELEFVGNYLDIEKFRQDNGFIYNIETGSNVDTGIKIPRMLIHTFAENAVKYAIRQVESDARLDISVKKSDARLYITLTDNGPGLKGTRKTEVTGTGKGLALVDEMARLYFDMTGVRISYSLEEVIENGVCTGTRAEITFNLKM